MNERAEAPILLTVREVSMLLRVQRPKVYELIKEGVIDGFKVGADWRIRRDSIENLIGAIPLNFFDGSTDDAEEDTRMNGVMSGGHPMPSIMK